jgi:isopentenyl-diphosphate Delta-isomerase
VNQPTTSSEIVSFEEEPLILVDEHDREIGQLDKSACHDGDGVRHRAFSLFIFDRHGALLLQRRASGKRLWPDYWSNSCCSHPRRGEAMADAVRRRLTEELGLEARLEFVYKFEYRARFGDLGTEHELCWVYLGRSDRDPVVNTNEIREWRWVEPAELARELTHQAARFTPWFRMEWEHLVACYPDRLRALGVEIPDAGSQVVEQRPR